jgi:hypothetical protein
VNLRAESGTAGRPRIVIEGTLDRIEVEQVSRIVAVALTATDRVEVDVRGVEVWGAGAISGLARCARLGPEVEIRMRGCATP